MWLAPSEAGAPFPPPFFLQVHKIPFFPTDYPLDSPGIILFYIKAELLHGLFHQSGRIRFVQNSKIFSEDEHSGIFLNYIYSQGVKSGYEGAAVLRSVSTKI